MNGLMAQSRRSMPALLCVMSLDLAILLAPSRRSQTRILEAYLGNFPRRFEKSGLRPAGFPNARVPMACVTSESRMHAQACHLKTNNKCYFPNVFR